MSTALIRPLAWEPPYSAGAAQEIATATTTKRQKTKDKKKKEIVGMGFHHMPLYVYILKKFLNHVFVLPFQKMSE